VPGRPKLLIFVVAYFAESTLRSVLERIPDALFGTYDCEILVVDDASEDRTFSIGVDYRREHPDVPLSVMRNERNQGYGGNQKVGYLYASRYGFDFVVMLHGDAQYAPEALPDLLEPLRGGKADAVFGSRMLEAGAARAGGMPLYKYVGNKILTRLQNALLGTRLSEFHSGYRAYSVRALERLNFLLNTNDFHFDTEIIIQLLNAGMRIVELPIPTYYGDEICRVNGMRYAGDVLLATLRDVAHRAGVLYRRRYAPRAEVAYEEKRGYPSSHEWALGAIPSEARQVMDLGGGTACVARRVAESGRAVTVVDARRAPRDLPPDVTFLQQDLDEPLAFSVEGHDCLLMLDVLEHLRDPELFLERLRAQFDYEPRTTIVSVPNVAFFVQRLMLLLGQFNYGERGILDRTHTRLFTFRSTRALLDDAGFRVKDVRGVPAPFVKALGDGWLARAATRANLALIAVSKTLFAYQIFVVAESTPPPDFVLRDTQRVSSERGGGRWAAEERRRCA
jgi:glycosyltransferase involved in cell wall biosynthesis